MCCFNTDAVAFYAVSQAFFLTNGSAITQEHVCIYVNNGTSVRLKFTSVFASFVVIFACLHQNYLYMNVCLKHARSSFIVCSATADWQSCLSQCQYQQTTQITGYQPHTISTSQEHSYSCLLSRHLCLYKVCRISFVCVNFTDEDPGVDPNVWQNL